MVSPEDATPETPPTPEGEAPSADTEPDRKPDEPGAQDAGAGEAAAEEQAEEEAELPQEPPLPLDVYAVLRVSIAQLASIAWQLMGLQPDPFTNKIRKEMDQARIAIDATAALVEQLRPHLQGQEAKDYQSLLTDLRLNFVKQSAEGSGEA
jgi:hypothetical protein